MSQLYDTIKADLEALVEKAKATWADTKPGVGKIFGLVASFANVAIKAAQLLGGTGPEKKAAVIETLESAYRDYIKPLDMWGFDAAIDYAIESVIIPEIPTLIDLTVASFHLAGFFAVAAEPPTTDAT